MSEPTFNDPMSADICRRMENIRCNLGNEVEEMVESARTLTDWRYYVKTYPWACVAGAAAVGFLLAPNKKEVRGPTPEMLEQLARKKKVIVVKSDSEAAAKNGFGGALLGMLVHAAVRSGVAYLGQNAGSFLRHDREENHAKSYH